MGRPNKIRLAGKEGVVRSMSANGATYRDIADALKEHHGVKVSHAAVGRFLIEETEERKTAAREVASRDAHDTVPMVTRAAKSLLMWNMTAAKAAFLGPKGTAEKPDTDVRDLAVATTAALAALKQLHALTMGERTRGEDPEEGPAPDGAAPVRFVVYMPEEEREE